MRQAFRGRWSRRTRIRAASALAVLLIVVGIGFAVIHASKSSPRAATAPGQTSSPTDTGSTQATSTPYATSPATAPASTVSPATQAATAPPPAVKVSLPNAQLTPGQTFSGVTASQVCTPGWASSHRHVTQEQYYQVYGEYGVRYPEPSGTYELDHLIPLELGGDNANANLWPEPASPAPGFHQKDDLENALHDMVCSGTLSIGEAQHEIASNWYVAYVKYVG